MSNKAATMCGRRLAELSTKDLILTIDINMLHLTAGRKLFWTHLWQMRIKAIAYVYFEHDEHWLNCVKYTRSHLEGVNVQMTRRFVASRVYTSNLDLHSFVSARTCS